MPHYKDDPTQGWAWDEENKRFMKPGAFHDWVVAQPSVWDVDKPEYQYDPDRHPRFSDVLKQEQIKKNSIYPYRADSIWTSENETTKNNIDTYRTDSKKIYNFVSTPRRDSIPRGFPENELKDKATQMFGQALNYIKENAPEYDTFKNYANDVWNYIKKMNRDTKDWDELAITTSGLFRDWVFGLGPERRHFNNDKTALAMQNAPGVEVVRDSVYHKLRQENSLKGFKLENREAPFNPFTAGFDPIEQFAGTCSADVNCYDGENLHFKLYNKTSLESFLYHITDGINYVRNKWGLPPLKHIQWKRETFPFMGNMWQEYDWDEPIDFSRLHKNTEEP